MYDRMNFPPPLPTQGILTFANQLKRLIPKFQKDFRVELENSIYKRDNFYEISEQCKKKIFRKI